MTGLKLLALASPLIAALGGSVVHKKLGTEASILARQKTWRDTLLLNEEMGYFPQIQG